MTTFFGRGKRSQAISQQGVGNKRRPDEVDIPAILQMWQTQKHFTMRCCQATGRCPLRPHPFMVSCHNRTIPIHGIEEQGVGHWAAQDHVPGAGHWAVQDHIPGVGHWAAQDHVPGSDRRPMPSSLGSTLPISSRRTNAWRSPRGQILTAPLTRQRNRFQVQCAITMPIRIIPLCRVLVLRRSSVRTGPACRQSTTTTGRKMTK